MPKSEPIPAPDGRPRCVWPLGDDAMLRYHDEEWGVPVHDDRTHFEYMILDGAQAGLSWRTVLLRRAGYRKAFADFDVEKVARFSERKIQALMLDPGIIRNQAKIRSSVANAQAFLKVQKEFGSFDAFIWKFAPERTAPQRTAMRDIPAVSEESQAMSPRVAGARLLQVRRPYNLLCVHAGGGHGERSSQRPAFAMRN